MKKTLGTIQTIMKIGRAISIIVLVCAIIGMVGSLIGGVCVYAMGEEIINEKIEMEDGTEITFGELVFDEYLPGIEAVYAMMIGAFIACLVEVIISDRAQKYFKFEIKEGTPFTFDGAKKLKNFGIVAIVLPIVGSILTEGAIMALSMLNPEALLGDIAFTSSIGTGVMAILIALVFKHGAELNEVQKQANKEKEALEKKAKKLEERRGYYF